MEAGKKRLARNTERQASSGEVMDLRREMLVLKELVADLKIENQLPKMHLLGWGETANEIPRFGEAENHPADRGRAGDGKTRLSRIDLTIPSIWSCRLGEAGRLKAADSPSYDSLLPPTD